MKEVVYGSILIAILACAGGVAQADQRNYVWTEEYSTPAQGSTEIEFFQTAITQDRHKRNASDWSQQIELEYGITDRLSASIYEVYQQDADSSSFMYVGYNLEIRYRMAEKNMLPLDVLLYAEHEVNSVEGNTVEASWSSPKISEGSMWHTTRYTSGPMARVWLSMNMQPV